MAKALTLSLALLLSTLATSQPASAARSEPDYKAELKSMSDPRLALSIGRNFVATTANCSYEVLSVLISSVDDGIEKSKGKSVDAHDFVNENLQNLANKAAKTAADGKCFKEAFKFIDSIVEVTTRSHQTAIDLWDYLKTSKP